MSGREQHSTESAELPLAVPFEVSATTEDGRLVGLVCRPPVDARLPGWVLYMHGFGSSQRGEKAEFMRRRCLAEGLSFVSFDFQGHGESGGSIRDLTITRCVRDARRVREWMRSQFRGPLVLMGSSMGGLTGLWSAVEQEAAAGAFVAPALGLDARFHVLIGQEGVRRWQESGILPITNEMGTFELGWQFVEDLRQRPSESLCRLHRLPTIIFQGKLDDRVSWEEVSEFAGCAVAKTTLVLFEDGDHRLLDKKETIWSRTRSFLAAIGLLGVDATIAGRES